MGKTAKLPGGGDRRGSFVFSPLPGAPGCVFLFVFEDRMGDRIKPLTIYLERPNTVKRATSLTVASALTSFVVALSCLPLYSVDKPTIMIQVVDTNTWQKDHAIHHAGTASQTNCDTTGNTNGTIYDTGSNVSTVNATTNATTNCTTKPGTPAYTTHSQIRQESIHAILPDGTHVVLWCQAGFRKCAPLAPGTYEAEPDGKSSVKLYVYSLVDKSKMIGKLKYRIADTW